MPGIVAAADETAATNLVHDAEALLPPVSGAGGGSLGPFTASWSASASFIGGSVHLRAPNTIELAGVKLNYNLSFSFSIDLNDFLPHFCLPRVCVFGICTPRICISWPTINIPISYSDSLTFTADFALNPHLVGAVWLVDLVIVGVPAINLSPAAAAILTALGLALGAILLPIPFIGPFLAALVSTLLAAIGIAGITGLLGPIVTLFVSGLTFTIYKQPAHFPVLPAADPIDPEIDITIASLNAAVQASDKNELVFSADITG